MQLNLALPQVWYNYNELAIVDPHTKWKENKLPTNDLNCVDAGVSSKSYITVIDDYVQTWLYPDIVKLSPFQDVEVIEFEDKCENNIPDLSVCRFLTFMFLFLCKKHLH